METMTGKHAQLRLKNNLLIPLLTFSLTQFGFNKRYEIALEFCGLFVENMNEFEGAEIILNQHIFTGILLSIKRTPHGPGTAYYHMTMGCPLHQLSNLCHHRLYINQTAVEIVKNILKEYKIKPIVHCRENDKLPYTAQGGVSDYDFLLRICIEQGLRFYYRLEQNSLFLYLTDYDISHQTFTLPFLHHPSFVSATPRITSLSYEAQILPQFIRIKSSIEGQDTHSFEKTLVNQTDVLGSGVAAFANPYPVQSSAQFEKQSISLLQQIDAQREWIEVEICDVLLQTGDLLHITNHPSPKMKECFRVVMCEGNMDTTHPLRQKIKLIPAKQVFKMPLPIVTKLNGHADYSHKVLYPKPALELALIKGKKEVDLDKDGRYRVYPLFNEKTQENNMNSPRLRRVLPHLGFHMPFIQNTRVVFAHLDNHIDKPIILGNLPCKSQPSPVTSENRHENIINFNQNSGLLFNESCDTEQSIHWKTSGSEHGFCFEKKVDIESISSQSLNEMNFYALKNIHIKSGQDLMLSAKKSEFLSEQEWSLRAEKTLMLEGAKGVLCQTQGNGNLKTKENLKMNCENDYRIKAHTFSFQGEKIMLKTKGFEQIANQVTIHSNQTVTIQVGSHSLQFAPNSLQIHAQHIYFEAKEIVTNNENYASLN